MEMINEETGKFKSDICHESVDVNENENDHLNLAQTKIEVKLEKQDLMCTIKEEIQENEYEFISVVTKDEHVKKEVDTDWKFQYAFKSDSEVMNESTDRSEPSINKESKLKNCLLEEGTSTSKISSYKRFQHEDSLCSSGKRMGKEINSNSTVKQECITNTVTECGAKVISKQNICIPTTFCALKYNNCNQLFHTKSYMNSHIATHADKSLFYCEICSKSFLRKHSLRRHIATHADNLPFKCEICKKSFLQNGQLKRHMQAHIDNRPFQCELCNKSFNLKSNLNFHVLTHTDNRTFQCEICNKSFFRRSCLNRHNATHRDIRPYPCKLCSKSFCQKGDLDFHLLSHADNRPFQCEICNKSFFKKSCLNRHNLIHTDKRPFQCQVCSKSFRQKCHLDVHLNTHNITV